MVEDKYKVRVIKEIFEESPDESSMHNISFSLFSRDIELPFPPYIGLEVYEEGIKSYTIERVQWGIDEKSFMCWTSKEYPRQALDTWLSYEYLIEHTKKTMAGQNKERNKERGQTP